MNSETVSDRLIVIVCVVIASVATGGSLYFSEIMGLSPCELCWIQRIAMYPLVIVLSVAAYEKRTEVWRTALPLSLGGGSVAAYHSYIQRTPSTSCSLDGGCGGIQYELFGLFAIPNMALIAFVAISIGLVIGAHRSR